MRSEEGVQGTEREAGSGVRSAECGSGGEKEGKIFFEKSIDKRGEVWYNLRCNKEKPCFHPTAKASRGQYFPVYPREILVMLITAAMH